MIIFLKKRKENQMLEARISEELMMVDWHSSTLPIEVHKCPITKLIFGGCVLGLWFILKLNNYGDV